VSRLILPSGLRVRHGEKGRKHFDNEINLAARLVNFASHMRVWASWDRRTRIFAVAVAAVALGSILYALILKTVVFGQQPVVAIDDIGEAAAAATASVACAWAARRAQGGNRLGWALMSVSTGLWAAGQIAWSVYEVFLQVPVPSPGLPDIGFLSAVPFAVAGIRAFWGDSRGTSARWRVWFDGLIVAIALTSTAWGFGLRLVWESNEDLFSKTFALTYPVGDILIGTVLILAIRRAAGQQKGRMAFLLCGVAAYSIADSAFAYLTAQGAYGAVGSVLNTGWFTGFLLIALAAVYPEAPLKAAPQEAPLGLWQLALPWMTLLTAAGGDFYTALSHQDAGLFQPAMTIVLAILLTVNMIIERREFLEMLGALRESRATLNEEFKTGLSAIGRMTSTLQGAERYDASEIRRLAADIRAEVAHLDSLVEDILDTEVEGADPEPASEVQVPAGVVAAVRP
jgi:diguanylate cyclase